MIVRVSSPLSVVFGDGTTRVGTISRPRKRIRRRAIINRRAGVRLGRDGAQSVGGNGDKRLGAIGAQTPPNCQAGSIANNRLAAVAIVAVEQLRWRRHRKAGLRGRISPTDIPCYASVVRLGRRIAWNGAAMCSALLFVATCILWIRSYWVGDWLIIERFYRHSTSADQVFAPTDFYRFTGLLFGSGHVALTWEPERSEDPMRRVRLIQLDTGPTDLSPPLDANSTFWNRLGFFTLEFPGSSTLHILPLWSIVVFLSLFPALWLRGLGRRHRDGCPNCGYDLRASPDRCPECGTLVKKGE